MQEKIVIIFLIDKLLNHENRLFRSTCTPIREYEILTACREQSKTPE